MTCFSGAEAYAKTTKRAIRRRWIVNFILIVDLVLRVCVIFFKICLVFWEMVYISKVR